MRLQVGCDLPSGELAWAAERLVSMCPPGRVATAPRSDGRRSALCQGASVPRLLCWLEVFYDALDDRLAGDVRARVPEPWREAEPYQGFVLKPEPNRPRRRQLNTCRWELEPARLRRCGGGNVLVPSSMLRPGDAGVPGQARWVVAEYDDACCWW